MKYILNADLNEELEYLIDALYEKPNRRRRGRKKAGAQAQPQPPVVQQPVVQQPAPAPQPPVIQATSVIQEPQPMPEVPPMPEPQVLDTPPAAPEPEPAPEPEQNPYAQQPYPPYGQDPYAQQPYPPYGQDPYAQQPYPPYGQDPYAQQPYPPYGQDPYAQQPYPPYGQDPYAQPQAETSSITYADEQITPPSDAPFPPENTTIVTSPTKYLRTKADTFFGISSAFITLFTLASLFVGFLVPYGFLPSIIAGRTVMLNNTLMGLILEAFRGSVTCPAFGKGYAVIPPILYFDLFAIAASVVVSLVFTILALCIASSARRFAFMNGIFVMLTFGTAFFFTFVYKAQNADRLAIGLLEFPTMIATGLTLVLLFVMAIVAKKGHGVTDFILLLFSSLALVAVFYPGSKLSTGIGNILSLSVSLKALNTIALMTVGGLVLINALLSLIRLCFGKRYLVDVLRFLFGMLGAVFYVVGTFFAEASLAVFTSQPLALVLLASSTIASLLLSALALAVTKKRKQHFLEAQIG